MPEGDADCAAAAAEFEDVETCAGCGLVESAVKAGEERLRVCRSCGVEAVLGEDLAAVPEVAGDAVPGVFEEGDGSDVRDWEFALDALAALGLTCGGVESAAPDVYDG